LIKFLNFYGTSFTEGGGFEFDLKPKTKAVYENIDEDLTTFNFSYPGQLQKLCGDSLKVNNYAKSGWGNERIYRMVIDKISEPNFKKEENIFFFEFSDLGRKEYFSKQLSDYVLVNYTLNENGYQTDNISLIKDYFTTKDIIEYEESLIDFDFYDKLCKNSLFSKNQYDSVIYNTIYFIDFLKYNNINFYVLDNMKHHSLIGNRIGFPNLMRFGNEVGSQSIFKFSNFDITYETENYIKDNHFGLIGNKYIAYNIYNNLISNEIILEKKLNTKEINENEILNTISKNINKLLAI